MHFDIKAFIIKISLVIVIALILRTYKSCTYEGRKYEPGQVVTIQLPAPSSPSTFPGLAEAMKSDKPVLIVYNPVSKLSSHKRQVFFANQLIKSYEGKAEIILLPNSFSYRVGDYMETLYKNMPSTGFGILQKDGEIYQFHTAFFHDKSDMDEYIDPIANSLEKILGPSNFNRQFFIEKESKYSKYNKAKKEGKSLILYSFEEACSRLKNSDRLYLVNNIFSSYANEVEIIDIKGDNFTDPANELYGKGDNLVVVYNIHTDQVYPCLFANVKDTDKNIRKSLDLR